MTHRTSPLPTASDALSGSSSIPLPDAWLAQVEPQLAGEEKILAWLEIDLNKQLRYSPGLLIVTSQRLLAKAADDEKWQDHLYSE